MDITIEKKIEIPDDVMQDIVDGYIEECNFWVAMDGKVELYTDTTYTGSDDKTYHSETISSLIRQALKVGMFENPEDEKDRTSGELIEKELVKALQMITDYRSGKKDYNLGGED